MDEGTIQLNETTMTPTSAGGPSPGLKRHADHQESNADSAQKLILEFSSVLGRPSIVLDPEDVKNLPRPFPSSGLHIRAIDGHTLVKFGKHIRLQEAEAMKFVCENTDIACPEVQSAYVLDGVGYIIMSWEDATPLQLFWEQATRTERDAVITNLSLHVAQMRTFKGDYVGGFGRNACVNDEFNWDFRREEGHRYGPYEDETAFNEGEDKGRVWIDNPASLDFKGEPDARWAKSEEVMNLGKGEIGKRGAALKRLLWGQK